MRKTSYHVTLLEQKETFMKRKDPPLSGKKQYYYTVGYRLKYCMYVKSEM